MKKIRAEERPNERSFLFALFDCCRNQWTRVCTVYGFFADSRLLKRGNRGQGGANHESFSIDFNRFQLTHALTKIDRSVVK